VHLIYQHKNYEGHARDYFSGTSMREHWDSGYEDTLRSLRHPEWLERSANTRGVTVHDLPPALVRGEGKREPLYPIAIIIDGYG
jgi:Patatin phospholipase